MANRVCINGVEITREQTFPTINFAEIVEVEKEEVVETPIVEKEEKVAESTVETTDEDLTEDDAEESEDETIDEE